ncbi:hypothetical protein GWI33_003785 [Rhynchophorus ferrugineus]|uniref:Uncharacterized protein n=1 Tax=Rhynchophorus ferrugineus TaxID=354439 RepID=A0A834HIX3_RHYFE|nr:hypothetical protein GWI33_003785 [Rhynchophorus ferrugineus]
MPDDGGVPRMRPAELRWTHSEFQKLNCECVARAGLTMPNARAYAYTRTRRKNCVAPRTGASPSNVLIRQKWNASRDPKPNLNTLK